MVGLVVEAGDAREVHHMACLVGFGAAAINPYMAFESIEDMCDRGVITGWDVAAIPGQDLEKSRREEVAVNVADLHRRILDRGR